MGLVLNAYILMVMDMTGIKLDTLIAAYDAHQVDPYYNHCRCGKDFDTRPARYYNHLAGSIAARARVPYGDAQYMVSALNNEAYKVEEAHRAAA